MSLGRLKLAFLPDGVSIRPYRKPDREAARQFAANDEHERPRLLARHRRLGEYRADGLAHFFDPEPESMFVAEQDGSSSAICWARWTSTSLTSARRLTPGDSVEGASSSVPMVCPSG